MFSRFDRPTIPVVTDSQPASHVAVASTRYAYLRRAVKIDTSEEVILELVKTNVCHVCCMDWNVLLYQKVI